MDILKIRQFLSCNGNGYGVGYGNGKGYGGGYGFGYGKGNGNGIGSGNSNGGDYYDFGCGHNDNGNGYGDGYGGGYGGYIGRYGNGNSYGNGYGIKSINGYDIYRVDNTPTIFTYIHGNIAKGYILERNVILKPCYIVKGNGCFAHGETLKESQSALEEKILNDMDIEEKIKSFKEKFPDVNKKYPVKDFYKWHHNLTGSCEMGRKAFAKSHNIDIDNDIMTVKEFINLTENEYCGEVIKELKESYKRELKKECENNGL